MGKALLWNSEFKGMQHETWYVQESSARSLRCLCALVTQSCPTLCDPWTVATRLLCPWDSPGKSTGVGCHSLLQGIFPSQGSNLGLPHCRQILYCLRVRGDEAGPR